MSIYRPLSQYLTRPEKPSAPNDEPFVQSRRIGLVNVTDRKSAIEAFYSIIGDRLYQVKRPQKTKGGIAWVVINDEDIEDDFALDGARGCVEEYVRVHVYGAGDSARDLVQNAADALRLAVNGFRNGTWGDRHINWCAIDPGGNAIGIAPIQGGDNWTLRTDINLRVFHNGPTANTWRD